MKDTPAIAFVRAMRRLVQEHLPPADVQRGVCDLVAIMRAWSARSRQAPPGSGTTGP